MIRLRLGRLSMLLALSVVLGGCGDDPVTRDEFIAAMRKVTSGPDRATPSLAGCIYDRIAGDSRLLEAASSSDRLSKRDEDRLASITESCWLAESEDDTTTTAKRSATTDRPTTTGPKSKSSK